MSSLQKDTKIYGAVQSESFITFTGFCKRIYDTAQQSVDVFIDEKKVDTILADQKIPDIENKYEVFDTNGFCFTYELPKEYIGQKHKLEFKTKDGEQLLHSPIITISPEHPFYNEWKFFNTIENIIIDEDNAKLYRKNAIGIVVIDEILENIEYMMYLKTLITKFSGVQFQIFYFNDLQKQSIKKYLGNNAVNVEYIIPTNIYSITSQIEIYMFKAHTNHKLYNELYKLFSLYFDNIYPMYYNQLEQKATSEKFTKLYHILHEWVMNDYEKLGLTKKDIENADGNYQKLVYNHIINVIDDTTNPFEFECFDKIMLVLKNEEFKQYCKKLTKFTWFKILGINE